jgi:hypothetical protein
MVILYEHLLKTQKEQNKIVEEQKIAETISLEDAINNGKNDTSVLENDTLWIETLQKMPETNFILFI